MTKKILFLLSLIPGLLMPSWVNAHGVISKFLGRGALVVEAHYSDAEPMCYAKVDVFAPGKQVPFQSGHTDANGHFAFHPDAPGKWGVVFLDGMGHRHELELEVKQPPALTNEQTPPPQAAAVTQEVSVAVTPTPAQILGQLPLNLKVVCGICLIFGTGGLLMMYKYYDRGKNA